MEAEVRLCWILLVVGVVSFVLPTAAQQAESVSNHLSRFPVYSSYYKALHRIRHKNQPTRHKERHHRSRFWRIRGGRQNDIDTTDKVSELALDCALRNSQAGPTTFAYVDENSPNGTILVPYMDIVGETSGENATITLSLKDTPDSHWVILDPTNQTLYLNVTGNNTLDRDGTAGNNGITSLRVTVVCVSNTWGTIEHPVTVVVTDLNDNAPQFHPDSYFVEVNELTPVGITILDGFSVTDLDGTNEIKFKIVENEDDPVADEFFTIPLPKTGAIVVSRQLDYDSMAPPRQYRLKVEAWDTSDEQDPSKNTAHTIVTVNITDGDDLGPLFEPCCDPVTYMANVTEKSEPNFLNPIPVSPNNIAAVDQDKNIQPVEERPNIVYSFFSGSPSVYREYLSIDNRTGDIILQRAVNREDYQTFSIVVKAEQDRNDPKPAYANLLITVLDLNDHTPEFDEREYVGFVGENSVAGTTVVTREDGAEPLEIRAMDLDGTEVMYSLLNYTDKFRLRPVGDVQYLIITQSLDREEQDTYELSVMASDGELTNMTTVVVTVVDRNDFTPQFHPPGPYITRLKDDALAGHVVYELNVTDGDGGAYGEVTFSILHVTNNGENKFAVQERNGTVTLEDESLLTGEVYTLTVMAADGAPEDERKSSVTTLEVRVIPANNQSRPTFDPARYYVSISEGAQIGTSLTTVHAFDAEGEPLHFGIADGNPDNTFNISSKVGQIILNKELDREDIPAYTLIVLVDDGNENGTATATVEVVVTDINDNNPIFNSSFLTEFTIQEEQDPPVLIGRVESTDADIGAKGEVEYHLVSSSFEISPVGAIYATQRLDREEQDQYVLVVTANDKAPDGRSSSVTLTVNVTDINDNSPQFPEDLYEVVLDENENATVLLTLQATDADLDPSLTYSIADGDTSMFTIDSTTGQLSNLQPLDFEMGPEYTLVVQADDSQNQGNTTVIVAVNDMNEFAPVFSQNVYTAEVLDNAVVGTIVTTVNATDNDVKGTPSAQVLYRLADEDSMAAGLFRVDRVSGVVTSRVNLRESPGDTYQLAVEAYDGGDPVMSSQTTVNITVLSSDTRPVFQKNLYEVPSLSENTPVGTDIVNVFAEGAAAYSIERGNAEGIFRIDSGGVVYVNKTLDHEAVTSYRLLIRAYSDQPMRKRRRRATETDDPDYAEILIALQDENDNPPVFTQDKYVTGVTETIGTFASVLKVEATDSDSGNFSTVRYSLRQSGEEDDTGNFAIEGSTGVIKTAIPFTGKMGKVLTVTVEASDGNNVASAQVLVTVMNEDNKVILVGNAPATMVDENRDKLLNLLSNITGGVAVIDNISPSVQAGTVDATKTEVGFYILDKETNQPMSKERILEILASKMDEINKLFGSFFPGDEVLEVRAPEERQVITTSLSFTEGALIALGCLIFLASVVGIIVIIITWRRRTNAMMQKHRLLYIPNYNAYEELDGTNTNGGVPYLRAYESQEVKMEIPEGTDPNEQDVVFQAEDGSFYAIQMRNPVFDKGTLLYSSLGSGSSMLYEADTPTSSGTYSYNIPKIPFRHRRVPMTVAPLISCHHVPMASSESVDTDFESANVPPAYPPAPPPDFFDRDSIIAIDADASSSEEESPVSLFSTSSGPLLTVPQKYHVPIGCVRTPSGSFHSPLSGQTPTSGRTSFSGHPLPSSATYSKFGGLSIPSYPTSGYTSIGGTPIPSIPCSSGTPFSSPARSGISQNAPPPSTTAHLPSRREFRAARGVPVRIVPLTLASPVPRNGRKSSESARSQSSSVGDSSSAESGGDSPRQGRPRRRKSSSKGVVDKM
ncbi:protocadherin-15-like isoform X2 [Branchiostoma floridae]|uniref:Protocadherin-15-like isoform X2 n=1 Tax=Branchiostoma floridae TaxID=7739 RepID=A0A9J7KTV2_BRAFL|nr:protocadherin-15-like isoform X2 [Branchiostoma floridae]